VHQQVEGGERLARRGLARPLRERVVARDQSAHRVRLAVRIASVQPAGLRRTIGRW
jgi:hypothetical protein